MTANNKLNSIIIPLPELRYKLLEIIKSGKTEMDLESFLLVVQKVYRDSK